MFGRILGGLAICAGGAACCYYSYQLVQNFGRNARMERNLGGTRNGIVLFGFALVVIGLLIVFGVFDVSSPSDQLYQSGLGTTSSAE